MIDELKYIEAQEEKYKKLADEYHEVGRDILYNKYHELELLMYNIYCLIQDGLKYRKLKDEERKWLIWHVKEEKAKVVDKWENLFIMLYIKVIMY